ncbi:DCN1-like protein 1/2 [Dioscorea alata]|uniref:DCN1-like protein 1/2 n=1 Tax=Dioscorea alata TaxID=55571 RepID=A0ACB7U805_DIOAL|nr:DCN1-like protein 1/2 [Dioscorea alata]
MGFPLCGRADIFEIYATYCDIVSQHNHLSAREPLAMLSKSLNSRWPSRDAIFNDLVKLMACLDLSADSLKFNCFYDFVFFVCRENGQKSITVSRAITAWRIVLTGRFRLLNQWCEFIEKYQRYNISEDAWRQLLAFSRCVNEDLDGYDPKGAWPVVIDDFVEHMYRINQSKCSTIDPCCSCGDMDTQPSISSTFRGLNLLPGSKRKSLTDTEGGNVAVLNSDGMARPDKRLKPDCDPNIVQHWELDSAMSGGIDETTDDQYGGNVVNKPSVMICMHSACAVEDSLSKGLEGHLSIGCCLPTTHKLGFFL